MIVVIDCGMGNLQSVVRALRRVGDEAIASSAIADIEAADKLVLPGVGSFAHGMESLHRNRLIPLLNKKVVEQATPVLGICLGQHMLTAGSEEGGVAGLGWIEGCARRIVGEGGPAQMKVPHLGWNTVDFRPECPLFRGVPAAACFYFAHSYCLYDGDAQSVAATTDYGGRFVSAVHRGNIFGTQFHPEKSQANGLTVLRNFVAYGCHE